MKLDLRFLLPNRISGQMTIVIVVSMFAVHAVLAVAFLLRTFEQRGQRPPGHPGQIEMAVAMLDAVAPGERSRLAEGLTERFPDIDLKLDRSRTFDWGRPDAPESKWFVRHLGPGFQMADVPADAAAGNVRTVAIRLRDGDVVTARFPLPPPRWRLFDPFMVTLLSVAIVVTGLGIWAARAVTAPLRSLAIAAESFSPDGAISLLPERGPAEIRTAARALNHMRERVKGLVDDRMRMLAAVGHDLRTPITRLRLSSEFVPDSALRGQMLRDLDQMRSMVDSILVYLREGRALRPAVSVDAAACVQTVCNAFIDSGADVRLVAAEPVSVMADPDELLRVITNVVDNAVRHGGGSARVSVRRTTDRAVILVEDDGPGIPDERKATMLQPFVRGAPGRNVDGDSGFGLGLAIVQAIVTTRGGTLTLRDRQPRGLSVAIEFPAEVKRA
jgi:signal transduction histidine kinase